MPRITREVALAALLLTAPAAAQNWIQSQVNGHWYAKTANVGWPAAQGIAQSWGGNLATVRSDAENTWIQSALMSSSEHLWIGLHDSSLGAFTWEWISGEPVTYMHWGGGQPDSPWEPYVHLICWNSDGTWNNLPDIDFHVCPTFGLVEVISDDCDNDGLPDAFEVATGGSAPACTTVSPSGTFSFAPVPLTITGPSLDSVTVVKLGGVAVPIVSQSPGSIVVQAQAAEPGSKSVELVTTTGESVIGSVALWPTLATSTTGIGGTATVSVRNGTAGIAVVAYATGLLPPPRISLPPTWSTLKLDITGPYVIVASYGLPSSGELDVAYPIPSDPSLAGTTAHIQAWCQQGFFGPGVTYSFTNAAAVTF